MLHPCVKLAVSFHSLFLRLDWASAQKSGFGGLRHFPFRLGFQTLQRHCSAFPPKENCTVNMLLGNVLKPAWKSGGSPVAEQTAYYQNCPHIIAPLRQHSLSHSLQQVFLEHTRLPQFLLVRVKSKPLPSPSTSQFWDSSETQ